MRARRATRAFWAALCLAALLLAACTGPPDPRQPRIEALEKIGFSLVPRLSDAKRLVMQKPADGLSISVVLPLPQKPPSETMGVAKREVAAMILVNGPQGVSGPEQDQVFFKNPDLHQAIALISQGAYPPEAAAEILDMAFRSAQVETGTGATVTSPKRGYGLAVMYKDRHLVRAVVFRFPGLLQKERAGK